MGKVLKVILFLGIEIPVVFLLVWGWSLLFQSPIGLNNGYLGTWLGFGIILTVFHGVLRSTYNNFPHGLFMLGWIILVTGIMLLQLSSWPTFRASEYYQSGLGPGLSDQPLTVLNRSENLQRLTTRAMAFQIVNKSQGVDVTIDGKTFPLSSQFSLDKDNGTLLRLKHGKYNGLYWVFPIDYTSFWTQLAQPYTPGYALVSATDPNPEPEVFLNYKMKFTRGSAFGQNINWHLYWNHQNLQLAEVHLELDFKMKPFWVSAFNSPSVGLAGWNLSHVAITDPETGDSQIFTVKEFLERRQKNEFTWISRIIPEGLAGDRIDWVSQLHSGWMNSVGFPGQNVLTRTGYEGSEVWFIPLKDRNVWLTGMTSIQGNDQSIVNFTMVDTITGEIWRVPLKGTDERGAIDVVKGALGADAAVWVPVLPNPVMIENVPFWSVTITDQQNIYRKVALTRIDNPVKVFFGETFTQARELAVAGGLKFTPPPVENIVIKPGEDPSKAKDPTKEGSVTLTLTKEEVDLLQKLLDKVKKEKEQKK